MSTGAILGIVIGAIVLLLLLGLGFFLLLGSGNNSSGDLEEPTQPGDTTAQEPTQDGEQPQDPNADIPGDGTFVVGEDVQPGEYRAVVPEDSYLCYWERLSDTTGDFEDIITNGIAEAGDEVMVTIEESDRAFGSEGCGSWNRA
ncbi:hypothetical protein FB566_3269 [Stackebrandtia endophytica]|uniref:Uncharacterized protein n=2 Tax=Stackebrandtia endophytica TaxID=1496996 RepID=A0A543AYQ3_9ACTN|nr:hypothetical protein FB566_3269 [Stackebrandtia endophytica]